MADFYTATYAEGELILAGKCEPAGSLAVRVLNLPKSVVSEMEALYRRRDDAECAAQFRKTVASLDPVANATDSVPPEDGGALLDDVICFRIYVRRALSSGLTGRGAEDFGMFHECLETMSRQLRREDNLRRTVLSTDLNPAVTFAVEDGRLCEKISFCSMRELLLFDLMRAMERSRVPRACKCCGEYFVPSRSGEVYCTGTAPDGEGKTCREVGARRKFAEKLSGNDVLRLYRAACGRVYTRKSRGGISASDAAEVINCCTALRDRALAGEMSIEELGEQLSAATRAK